MKGYHPGCVPSKPMPEIVFKSQNDPIKHIGRRTGKVFDENILNGNDIIIKDDFSHLLDNNKNAMDLYASDPDSSSEEEKDSDLDWSSDPDSDSDDSSKINESKDISRSITNKKIIDPLNKISVGRIKVKDQKELVKKLKNVKIQDYPEVEEDLGEVSDDESSPDFKKIKKQEEAGGQSSHNINNNFNKDKSAPIETKLNNNINATNNFFLKSTNKKNVNVRVEVHNKDNVSNFKDFIHETTDAKKFSSHDETNLSFALDTNKKIFTNVENNNKQIFMETEISMIRKREEDNSPLLTDAEFEQKKETAKKKNDKSIKKVIELKKEDLKEEMKENKKDEKKENKKDEIIKKRESIKNIKMENKVEQNENKKEVYPNKQSKKENNKNNIDNNISNRIQIEKNNIDRMPLEEIPDHNLDSYPNINNINRNEDHEFEAKRNKLKRTYKQAKLDNESDKEEIKAIKMGKNGKKIVMTESQFIKDNYNRMQESQPEYNLIEEDEDGDKFFGVSNRYSKRIRVKKLNHLAGERMTYKLVRDPILKIHLPFLVGVSTNEQFRSYTNSNTNNNIKTNTNNNFKTNTNSNNTQKIIKPKSKRRLVKGLKKVDEQEENEDSNDDEIDIVLPEDYQEEAKSDSDDEGEIFRVPPQAQKGESFNLQENLQCEVLTATGKNRFIAGNKVYKNIRQGNKFLVPANCLFNFINLSKEPLRIKLDVSGK